MNTQLANLTQNPTNMRGNQTRMSGLYMARIKFSNTPEDKFHNQRMLIRLMRKIPQQLAM